MPQRDEKYYEEAVECCDCDDIFYRSVDDSWRVRCVPCWKAYKLKENPNWSKNYRSQYEYQREQRGQSSPPPPSEDSRNPDLMDRLSSLIILCHPDKHNNSRASVEITQWLLSLR